MRKTTYNIFILLTVVVSISFIPGTKESQKEWSYNKADIIFLGELLSPEDLDSESYDFKIYEIYKGKYDRSLIGVKKLGDSTMIPTIKGLWLVYGNFLSDSAIYINKSSVSRSNYDPDLTWWYRNNIPPPLLDSTEVGLLNLKFESLERKFDAVVEWYNDVEKLRNNSEINEVKSFILNPLIVKILMGINVVLVLIIILIIIKRK